MEKIKVLHIMSSLNSSGGITAVVKNYLEELDTEKFAFDTIDGLLTKQAKMLPGSRFGLPKTFMFINLFTRKFAEKMSAFLRCVSLSSL